MAIRSSHSAFSCLDNVATSWAEFALLASRVLVGWLFLMTGWGKISGIPGATAYFTGLGVPVRIVARRHRPDRNIDRINSHLRPCDPLCGDYHRYFRRHCYSDGTSLLDLSSRSANGSIQSLLEKSRDHGRRVMIFIQGGGRYSIDAILVKK